MRFLYNYLSSDDSIRRCSAQVDDVFHHHFCHFLTPTTLPYQAYLGTIGTDDAIGSFKKGSYSRGQVMYLVLVEGSSRLVA